MAASIPSPSRSSLISFIVSTSRLSYWTTTRSFIVARSIGAMSMSGAAVTSIPPEWIERWRGKPSMRAHSSSQRSQSERSRDGARVRDGRSGPARGARRCCAAPGGPRPARGPSAWPPRSRRRGRRRRRRARGGRRAGRAPTGRRSGRSRTASMRRSWRGSQRRSSGMSTPRLGIDAPGDLPVRRPALGAVARRAVPRPEARPQPRDAGRGVARAALVVGLGSAPDRGSRARCAVPRPGVGPARCRRARFMCILAGSRARRPAERPRFRPPGVRPRGRTHVRRRSPGVDGRFEARAAAWVPASAGTAHGTITVRVAGGRDRSRSRHRRPTLVPSSAGAPRCPAASRPRRSRREHPDLVPQPAIRLVAAQPALRPRRLLVGACRPSPGSAAAEPPNRPPRPWLSWPIASVSPRSPRAAPRAPGDRLLRDGSLAGRAKNCANPPSASRSRRTITESYVSSAFATRSTSGRGNPSAYPTSRTADRARYVTRLQTIPVCSVP